MLVWCVLTVLSGAGAGAEASVKQQLGCRRKMVGVRLHKTDYEGDYCTKCFKNLIKKKSKKDPCTIEGLVNEVESIMGAKEIGRESKTIRDPPTPEPAPEPSPCKKQCKARDKSPGKARDKSPSKTQGKARDKSPGKAQGKSRDKSPAKAKGKAVRTTYGIKFEITKEDKDASK